MIHLILYLIKLLDKLAHKSDVDGLKRINIYLVFRLGASFLIITGFIVVLRKQDMAFNILTNAYSKLPHSIRVQSYYVNFTNSMVSLTHLTGLRNNTEQPTLEKHLDMMISAEKSDQMEVLYAMSVL